MRVATATGPYAQLSYGMSWVFKVTIPVVCILKCLQRVPTNTNTFLRINGVAKIPTAWKNETKVEWKWNGMVAYSEGVATEEGNKVVVNAV